MALSALICGLLFGAGLAVSGMVNPDKVLAFLDVAGDWDPSLALVMAAALVPSAIAYKWIPARGRPLAETAFHLPSATGIDRDLIVGGILFGAGWGLIGLCPGPAIAGLAYGRTESVIYFIAMVAGIALSRFVTAHKHASPASETG